MTAEPRRVAVLGGTFDPVHRGHLALAAAARDALGAAEAWLLPARAPALREPPVAPPDLRLAMLEAAARELPRLRVVDLEMRRPGISYTIDTLEALARERPDTEPWWILGADAVRRLGAWHRSADLLALLRVAVVQRAGVPPVTAAEAAGLGLDPARSAVLELVPPPVSASEVRRRVAAGEPIDGLVPPAVAAIIAASGVYRAAPAVR